MPPSAAFFDAIRPSFGKLSQGQVDGITNIIRAFDERGNGKVEHLAYLLATARHETAGTMQPIYERGAKAYFAKYEPGTKLGKALGNTVKGDGYRYRGRGYVQITGRANYRKFTLEDEPDKALDPEIAANILVIGCIGGKFTGKKLSDYSTFAGMRRVVNGTDKAALIAGYAEAFLKALKPGNVVLLPKGIIPFSPTEPPKEPTMPNTIFNDLFPKIESVLKRDNVPVADKDTGKVAAEVTAKVAPIVENATNSEPWYKSRIYLGLISAAVGFVGMKVLGVTITQDDVLAAGDGIASVVTSLGLLYALYGRIVGTKKPPIGGGSV